MELDQDIIVNISKEREKYFGCAGKMLLPCARTVEALLKEVPPKKLISTELLQRELAQRAGAQVTCPVATRYALQAIARSGSSGTAYWRVVKKNGDLVAYFPGGREAQASVLAGEGFAVDIHGKIPRVAGIRELMVQF